MTHRYFACVNRHFSFPPPSNLSDVILEGWPTCKAETRTLQCQSAQNLRTAPVLCCGPGSWGVHAVVFTFFSPPTDSCVTSQPLCQYPYWFLNKKRVCPCSKWNTQNLARYCVQEKGSRQAEHKWRKRESMVEFWRAMKFWAWFLFFWLSARIRPMFSLGPRLCTSHVVCQPGDTLAKVNRHRKPNHNNSKLKNHQEKIKLNSQQLLQGLAVTL